MAGREVSSHEDAVPEKTSASSLSWPPKIVGAVQPLLCLEHRQQRWNEEWQRHSENGAEKFSQPLV